MSQEGRVFVRASSAPPDSTPVWVDLTPYLHDGDRGSGWSVADGRQTTLGFAEPARLSLTLDNADHRFTPGNTSSPYFPWWTQGCRLQLQETIGPWSSEYPDFFLELPDVIIDLPDVDQVVTVNAVDRLGRLQSSRTFISTLAEHILYVGGSSLKAYWICNDPAAPFADLIGTAGSLVAHRDRFNSGFPVATQGTGLGPRLGPSVERDDVPSLLLNPSVDTSGFSVDSTFLQSNLGGGLVQGASDVVAVAFWATFRDTNSDAPEMLGLFDNLARQLWWLRQGVTWTFQAAAAGFDTQATPTPPQGSPMLVAMRLTLTTGVAEFWRNADTPVIANTGGPPLPSITWDRLTFGDDLDGSVGHIQLYIGPNAYSRSMHLAQYQMGLYGLERQSTGERIRTIAGYAGVPAGEVDADNGVAVMSRARLADKDPLAALREAETTEQGRLFCVGPNVTFHDRRRRYDI